jgi:hypothetical protein
MATTATIQAHIAYELIEDTNPPVVAIEFLSREIADPLHARQLGEQLESLVRFDFCRETLFSTFRTSDHWEVPLSVRLPTSFAGRGKTEYA